MKLRNIIIGGAIVSILAGFVLGKTLVAESPVAGSSSDPVVSKSYADKAIGDRVTELEKQVADLTVQAQALQTTINELQAKVNKTGGKTTPQTGQTGTQTGSTPGTTTGTQTGSSTGKSVTTSSSAVNLRSTPSTSSSIVGKLTKGETATILQSKDSWYQVKLANGTTGWVASWVVQLK